MKKKLINFIEENHYESDEFPHSDSDSDEVMNFTIITESIDKRTGDFETPLLSALIRTNKFELALQLALKPGVQLEALDSVGKTPLDYALEKGDKDLILALGGEVASSSDSGEQSL